MLTPPLQKIQRRRSRSTTAFVEDVFILVIFRDIVWIGFFGDKSIAMRLVSAENNVVGEMSSNEAVSEHVVVVNPKWSTSQRTTYVWIFFSWCACLPSKKWPSLCDLSSTHSLRGCHDITAYREWRLYYKSLPALHSIQLFEPDPRRMSKIQRGGDDAADEEIRAITKNEECVKVIVYYMWVSKNASHREARCPPKTENPIKRCFLL